MCHTLGVGYEERMAVQPAHAAAVELPAMDCEVIDYKMPRTGKTTNGHGHHGNTASASRHKSGPIAAAHQQQQQAHHHASDDRGCVVYLETILLV